MNDERKEPESSIIVQYDNKNCTVFNSTLRAIDEETQQYRDAIHYIEEGLGKAQI